MPKKYHIDVKHTPNRLAHIGRSGIVDWGEGCLKCSVCVKQECVYNVYKERKFSADIMGDTIDEYCKNCYRCVQGCPRRLIHKTINPEWETLGDDVYTPEIITVNWKQAETGKIPVSGAGYGGAFSGDGFDSMWTDMSEIVRPTRDGIHGREYISTVVDIGRRPSSLQFDEDGRVRGDRPAQVRIPLPILFNVLPFGDISSNTRKAMALAAEKLGTRMVLPQSLIGELPEHKNTLIPLLEDDNPDSSLITQFSMVELPDTDDVAEKIGGLKGMKSDLIVSVKTPAGPQTEERVVELAGMDADVVHVAADPRGYEPNVENPRHIKDVIRAVHAALLAGGLRDRVTVLASGGIAMAEHVIKSMLCGANAVSVDVPMLIALECRVCRNCDVEAECPARISTVDPDWGAQRMINLIGAWHNQILEMMGAMGIREARRLRGEQGRVMFFEDLEAETFGVLFGKAR